ncbi:MAG TPA: cobalamin-dependent protein [Acidimicrobiia bacterium]|nr:cobalamin-dependent protein [Acidimicrobiia bacterium]
MGRAGSMVNSARARVLVAKTSLDGHWVGVFLVTRALRDAGFEVVSLGQATCDQIAAAAVEEDVALVGLNVGGRVEVVERVVRRVRERAGDVAIMAGGTIPPWARDRLEAEGVTVFTPGSSLESIVDTARRLTAAATP